MVCAADLSAANNIAMSAHARKRPRDEMSLFKYNDSPDLGSLARGITVLIDVVCVLLRIMDFELFRDGFEQLAIGSVATEFPDHHSAQSLVFGVFQLSADGYFIVISPKGTTVKEPRSH